MDEHNNDFYETGAEPVPDRSDYLPAAPAPEPAPQKRKKKGAGRIVALALCCSLLGGAAGAAGTAWAASGYLKEHLRQTEPAESGVKDASTPESGSVSLARTESDGTLTAAEIYARNVNSTVGITTSITTNYFGFQTTSAASGSGFILTADGYIVTNYHVIEDSDTVRVTTYDGTAYDAVIVGGDETNDLAVLKIDAQGLSPVTLGSSDELRVGDPVVAIGNPLGELTFSLTHGDVSALDRKITLSSGVSMELIQTDCAINAGNSGGALFNMYGQVIGITNAKYSSSGSGEASIDNIGFAIPIDSVKDLITQIIEKGCVTAPYIGVRVESVSDDMAALGVPKGAIIRSVTEDGPAAKAGLRVNDIVTAVNGTAIASGDDLVEVVGKSSPGDSLLLTLRRGGQETQIAVTVGEQVQGGIDTGSDEEQSTQPGLEENPFPWGWFFGR